MNSFFKKKINQIRATAIIIISIITFILMLIVDQLNNDYQQRLLSIENDLVENYEAQYETVIYCYRELSHLYFDKIQTNNRILEIMNEANSATEKQRNELRNELIELSNYDYQKSVEDSFRQYHYVLKDNTSFLRMHRKEKFGDDLSSFRYTVSYVNDNHEYIEGFEEGRIFNGYRFEYPLFYNNEYVGCVEISLSYSAISKLMEDLYDTNCSFIINKSVVESKVLEDEIAINYSPVSFSNDYYIDNDTKDSIDYNLQEILINQSDVTSLLLENKTFHTHSVLDDIDYCNGFISIKNVEGLDVGYLIFSNNCTHIFSLENTYILQLVLLSLLWLVCLILVILVSLNRIQIERVTNQDKLTNAYNRNLLYQSINQEIIKYKKQGTIFSIILFDIDDFKLINDTYGHIKGDLILKNISEIVVKELSIDGYLFRYGGDEFLIVLPNIDKEIASKIANEIKNTVNNYKFDKIDKTVTLSMGVMNYKGENDVESLILQADRLLYHAKKLGKNIVCNKIL